MRFYNGYAPAMGFYGYYGEPPEQMYGQYDPGYGPVGYYGEDPYLAQQYPYSQITPLRSATSCGETLFAGTDGSPW